VLKPRSHDEVDTGIVASILRSFPKIGNRSFRVSDLSSSSFNGRPLPSTHKQQKHILYSLFQKSNGNFYKGTRNIKKKNLALNLKIQVPGKNFQVPWQLGALYLSTPDNIIFCLNFVGK
jgi:hypothetical protein